MRFSDGVLRRLKRYVRRHLGGHRHLQDIRNREGELAGEAPAEAAGIPAAKVRVAIGCYAAYPDKANDRITANREAAQEVEAAWRAGQELLRGQAS